MAELNLIGYVHQVTLVLNKCIDTMEQLKKKGRQLQNGSKITWETR